MGGGETILVVEDDAEIRDLTVAALAEIGYGARAAADADAALRSLDAAPDVDLLLTDVVLPGQTSGLDLAQQVRARRPAIKILLTSGYIDPAEHRAASGGIPVLRKPYRRDDLARKVRTVLGRRA